MHIARRITALLFLTQIPAALGTSDWSGAAPIRRGGWRCVQVGSGARCVTTSGTSLTLELLAGNWACQTEVRMVFRMHQAACVHTSHSACGISEYHI